MIFAEREGFEPPVRFRTSVFKTDAIDHSAIFPKAGAKVLLLIDICKYLRTFFDYLSLFGADRGVFSVSGKHSHIVRQREQQPQRMEQLPRVSAG